MIRIPTDEKIVCIVDDEVDITTLFRDALCGKIEGISIDSFNDPVIAFEHFTENKNDYALVISDLRMPGINGLELLKKAKKLNPIVRTILMSAYEVQNDQVQKYIKEGIIDIFIPKPIPLQKFCTEVNNQVQSHKFQSRKLSDKK